MQPNIRKSALALLFLAGAWQGCDQSATDDKPDAPVYAARRGNRIHREDNHLVILDRSALAANQSPNAFRPADINADRPSIGNRAPLRFFQAHIGREIILPGGEAGNEGWFVFSAIRDSWKHAGPDPDDGLRNYLEAGPGLGRPDAKGRPEFLLDRVSGLEPLRATGLARLEGHTVCGVVLDGEVAFNADSSGADIRGPNLGKVGLEILRCDRRRGAGPDELPQVKARILDARGVCEEDLAVFRNAPDIRRCNRGHPDVDRPACVLESDVLTEEWNAFDTTKWIGDGDQWVADGVFMARPEASSAAADYIPSRPVAIDSNGSVRFSNLTQLLGAGEKPFAESGALFAVNVDPNGDFSDYVFVNVGYTLAPSLVFVELFGANDGVEFDQFQETSIAYSPAVVISVDLRVRRTAYEVSIRNEAIDTVPLANPLASLGLFEVGVQQNAGGLRGRILSTAISQDCPRDSGQIRPRRHFTFRGKPWKRRLGKGCRTRDEYVRWARTAISRTRNPSWGLRCLARMREKGD